jgi:hypothetical protein
MDVREMITKTQTIINAHFSPHVSAAAIPAKINSNKPKPRIKNMSILQ